MGAAAVIKRSRFKGLRDFYVALITKNTAEAYTTETPVKLARAIKAKISDKHSSEDLESDDEIEDTAETYEGTEVEIEVNSLAPQDEALLMGHKYENGYLVKNKDDKAPELAFGYRAKRMDNTYEFHWLYCGRFAQGREENRETGYSKPTPQTETIKGNFYSRKIDGNYETSVDEANLMEEHATAKAAIADWFSKVQEPAGTEAAEA